MVKMSSAGDYIGLSDISSNLTTENLKMYLQEEFGTNAILVNYTILGGAAKGDSYLSSVRRIEVEGKSSVDSKKFTLHLIVKFLPLSIARRKTFRSVEFFQNEVAFYNKVVPAFMTFQKKQKPKHPFTELPRCFYALADGENDCIVMEDMSYKNYITASRQDGLSFAQCELILNVLARFHALSFAMNDKEPEAFKRTASSLYETYYKPETKPWYIDQLQVLTGIALDAVAKELPDKLYEEKFRKFTDENLYERMIELAKPREPYAVICHGDAWAPNFLMCNDSIDYGRVERVCMLDFQLARYGSPVLDVAFFLYACASHEVMFGRFDNLLESYYKKLTEFLTDLGSPADKLYPYHEFQKDVVSYFAFGLGMSLESVPFSVLEENELPDIESITGDQQIPLSKILPLKPIERKEGRIRLANNIKHAVDNGFI